MTDRETLLSLLAKVEERTRSKTTDAAFQRYHEEGRRIVVEGGYADFVTHLFFDDAGNLIDWGSYE